MGRLLAIDHGERRIGLAISDPNKIISKPLTTLLMSDINILYNKFLCEHNRRQMLGNNTKLL